MIIRILAINKNAIVTTDRHHVVMNYCSLATVVVVSENIDPNLYETHSLFDSKFAWYE